MTLDYFPLGLAQGAAFCNRQAEMQRLLTNISHAKPTLIMSPRRYGKTSLALNTIAKSKLPFAHIDFFSEISPADIENSIMKGMGIAISKIIPAPKRALKAAQEFFAEMKVKLAIQGTGATIEFERQSREPQNLKAVLAKFDSLVKKHNKKVVLFMDEFQRLNQIQGDISIEGTIRHIAQQSKNIIFIFSGSNRHLLKQMFEDRSRPFYKLCDRIILDRISAEHYKLYIQHAGKQHWRQAVVEEVIELILSLTELHPYYVNSVCSRLWLNKKPPTVHEVNAYWDRLAIEDRSQIAAELDLLSNNQRKLLISLARHGNTSVPLSKEFSRLANLSTSSVAQALAVLEEKDYIYQDANGYYNLIDPLMKKVIGNSHT